MAHFITKSCTKCGICLPECPTNSIIIGKEYYLIDADTCADHVACVKVCPLNAIVPIETAIPAWKHHEDEDEEEEN
jgi:ferredoxin